jgi:hypothetical protein
MFLSEFDFKLIWGPGIKNVADTPSYHPDLVLQKGDDTLEAQYRTLLKSYHTDLLFPTGTLHPLPKTTISALTTLTIDNSKLLECFKHAFQDDEEWKKALVQGNPDFSTKSGIIFYKGCLFVPATLQAEVLHSCYNTLVAGHPGCTCTLKLVQCNYS